MSADISKKYNDYLRQYPYVQTSMIDVLNESIQSLSLPAFGYNSINYLQTRQPGSYSSTAENVISNENPQNLAEKTFTISIRHCDAYLTYFAMLEIFFNAYDFANKNTKHFGTFVIETLSATGHVIYQLELQRVIFTGISELQLSYAQTDRTFQTFDCTFMYSEFSTAIAIPQLKLTNS